MPRFNNVGKLVVILNKNYLYSEFQDFKKYSIFCSRFKLECGGHSQHIGSTCKNFDMAER